MELKNTEDLTVTAYEKEYFEVTVIVNGTKTVMKVTEGEAVDFSQFVKEGYTFKVMNEKGDIITSLMATKDCVISVIYFKN